MLFIIMLVILFLWLAYAGWSAPLMRENKDGSWTTIQPQKRFKDLFKKSKKK